MKRSLFFRKSIAIFVSLSLILSESLSYASSSLRGAGRFAARTEAISESEIASASSGAPPRNDDRQTISIPPELGRIEESFEGTSGKTLVYIQDAHDSLEAQENIAKLIHYFVEHYGVKTVFEEGYEGPVPTEEYFGFIKDLKIKEKVSYFLMDKLRIGGAEYAHINRKKDFQLIGADSIKLHLENIRWYREAAKRKEETTRDLRALSSEIDSLASRYFPKELKEWMKLKKRFDEKQIPLLDYLKRMVHLSQSVGAQFIAPSKGRDTSSSAAKPRESRPYSQIILLLTAESTRDPAFLEKAKGVDAKILFEEIDSLENDFATTLLEKSRPGLNPASLRRDRQIFHYHKALALLGRLNEIELTPAEYETLVESRSRLNTQSLARFIVQNTKKSIVLSKRWEENIRDSIRFYEISQARDRAIERALTRHSEGPPSPAILVFGGFHKERIKELLKRKSIAGVILSPRISEIDPKHQEYYRRLMALGRHPFEIPLSAAHASRAATFYDQALTPRGKKIAQAELRRIEEVIRENPALDSSLLDRQITAALTGLHRAEVRAKAPLSQEEPVDLGAPENLAQLVRAIHKKIAPFGNIEQIITRLDRPQGRSNVIERILENPAIADRVVTFSINPGVEFEHKQPPFGLIVTRTVAQAVDGFLGSVASEIDSDQDMTPPLGIETPAPSPERVPPRARWSRVWPIAGGISLVAAVILSWIAAFIRHAHESAVPLPPAPSRQEAAVPSTESQGLVPGLQFVTGKGEISGLKEINGRTVLEIKKKRGWSKWAIPRTDIHKNPAMEIRYRYGGTVRIEMKNALNQSLLGLEAEHGYPKVVLELPPTEGERVDYEINLGDLLQPAARVGEDYHAVSIIFSDPEDLESGVIEIEDIRFTHPPRAEVRGRKDRERKRKKREEKKHLERLREEAKRQQMQKEQKPPQRPMTPEQILRRGAERAKPRPIAPSRPAPSLGPVIPIPSQQNRIPRPPQDLRDPKQTEMTFHPTLTANQQKWIQHALKNLDDRWLLLKPESKVKLYFKRASGIFGVFFSSQASYDRMTRTLTLTLKHISSPEAIRSDLGDEMAQIQNQLSGLWLTNDEYQQHMATTSFLEDPRHGRLVRDDVFVMNGVLYKLFLFYDHLFSRYPPDRVLALIDEINSDLRIIPKGWQEEYRRKIVSLHWWPGIPLYPDERYERDRIVYLDLMRIFKKILEGDELRELEILEKWAREEPVHFINAMKARDRFIGLIFPDYLLKEPEALRPLIYHERVHQQITQISEDEKQTLITGLRIFLQEGGYEALWSLFGDKPGKGSEYAPQVKALERNDFSFFDEFWVNTLYPTLIAIQRREAYQQFLNITNRLSEKNLDFRKAFEFVQNLKHKSDDIAQEDLKAIETIPTLRAEARTSKKIRFEYGEGVGKQVQEALERHVSRSSLYRDVFSVRVTALGEKKLFVFHMPKGEKRFEISGVSQRSDPQDYLSRIDQKFSIARFIRKLDLGMKLVTRRVLLWSLLFTAPVIGLLLWIFSPFVFKTKRIRPWEMEVENNPESIHRLIVATVNWLLEEGYGKTDETGNHRRVLSNFKEAIERGRVEPMPKESRGLSPFRKEKDDEEVSLPVIYLDYDWIYELVQRAKTPELFILRFAASIASEAWGFSYLFLASEGHADNEEAEKIIRALADSFNEVIIKVAPKLELSGVDRRTSVARLVEGTPETRSFFLEGENRARLFQAASIYLASELLEVERRREFLRWVERQGLIDPERILEPRDRRDFQFALETSPREYFEFNFGNLSRIWITSWTRGDDSPEANMYVLMMLLAAAEYQESGGQQGISAATVKKILSVQSELAKGNQVYSAEFQNFLAEFFPSLLKRKNTLDHELEEKLSPRAEVREPLLKNLVAVSSENNNPAYQDGFSSRFKQVTHRFSNIRRNRRMDLNKNDSRRRSRKEIQKIAVSSNQDRLLTASHREDVGIAGARRDARDFMSPRTEKPLRTARHVFVEKKSQLSGKGDEVAVFQLLGHEVERSPDMLPRQLGVIVGGGDFFSGDTRLKKLQHQMNHNPGRFPVDSKARLSVTEGGDDRYVFFNQGVHDKPKISIGSEPGQARPLALASRAEVRSQNLEADSPTPPIPGPSLLDVKDQFGISRFKLFNRANRHVIPKTKAMQKMMTEREKRGGRNLFVVIGKEVEVRNQFVHEYMGELNALKLTGKVPKDFDVPAFTNRVADLIFPTTDKNKPTTLEKVHQRLDEFARKISESQNEFTSLSKQEKELIDLSFRALHGITSASLAQSILGLAAGVAGFVILLGTSYLYLFTNSPQLVLVGSSLGVFFLGTSGLLAILAPRHKLKAQRNQTKIAEDLKTASEEIDSRIASMIEEQHRLFHEEVDFLRELLGDATVLFQLLKKRGNEGEALRRQHLENATRFLSFEKRDKEFGEKEKVEYASIAFPVHTSASIYNLAIARLLLEENSEQRWQEYIQAVGDLRDALQKFEDTVGFQLDEEETSSPPRSEARSTPPVSNLGELKKGIRRVLAENYGKYKVYRLNWDDDTVEKEWATLFKDSAIYVWNRGPFKTESLGRLNERELNHTANQYEQAVDFLAEWLDSKEAVITAFNNSPEALMDILEPLFSDGSENWRDGEELQEYIRMLHQKGVFDTQVLKEMLTRDPGLRGGPYDLRRLFYLLSEFDTTTEHLLRFTGQTGYEGPGYRFPGEKINVTVQISHVPGAFHPNALREVLGGRNLDGEINGFAREVISARDEVFKDPTQDAEFWRWGEYIDQSITVKEVRKFLKWLITNSLGSPYDAFDNLKKIYQENPHSFLAGLQVFVQELGLTAYYRTFYQSIVTELQAQDRPLNFFWMASFIKEKIVPGIAYSAGDLRELIENFDETRDEDGMPRSEVRMNSSAQNRLQRVLAGLDDRSLSQLYKGPWTPKQLEGIKQLVPKNRRFSSLVWGDWGRINPIIEPIFQAIRAEAYLRILDTESRMAALTKERPSYVSISLDSEPVTSLLRSPFMKARVEKIAKQDRNRTDFVIAHKLFELRENLGMQQTVTLPRGTFIVDEMGRLIWKKHGLPSNQGKVSIQLPDAIELITAREPRGLYAVELQGIFPSPWEKTSLAHTVGGGGMSKKQLRQFLKEGRAFRKSILSGYTVTERKAELNPDEVKGFINVIQREIEIVKDVPDKPPNLERNLNFVRRGVLEAYLGKITDIYDPETGRRRAEMRRRKTWRRALENREFSDANTGVLDNGYRSSELRRWVGVKQEFQPLVNQGGAGVSHSNQDDAGALRFGQRQDRGEVKVHRQENSVLAGGAVQKVNVGRAGQTDMTRVKGIESLGGEPTRSPPRHRHIKKEFDQRALLRGDRKIFFAGQIGAVLKRLVDIFWSQIRIILEDLFGLFTRGQKIQDQMNGNPQAPDHRLAAQHPRIKRNPLEFFHLKPKSTIVSTTGQPAAPLSRAEVRREGAEREITGEIWGGAAGVVRFPTKSFRLSQILREERGVQALVFPPLVFLLVGYTRTENRIKRKAATQRAARHGMGSPSKNWEPSPTVTTIWAKVIELLATKAHLLGGEELLSVSSILALFFLERISEIWGNEFMFARHAESASPKASQDLASPKLREAERRRAEVRTKDTESGGEERRPGLERFRSLRRLYTKEIDPRWLSYLAYNKKLREILGGIIAQGHEGELLISVGAGTGVFEKELVRRGLRVVALDVVKEFLDKAAAQKIPSVLADGHRLPFPDQSVDRVLFPESIGDMDIEKALREAARILKPGGALHILTYTSSAKLWFGYRLYRKTEPEELLALMRRAGFVETAAPPLDLPAPHYFYATGRKPLSQKITPVSSQGKPVTGRRAEVRDAANHSHGKYAVVFDMNVFDALSEEQKIEIKKLIHARPDVKFVFNITGDRRLDPALQELMDFRDRHKNIEIRIDPTSFDFQGRKVIHVSKEGIKGTYADFLERQLNRSKDFYRVRYREGDKEAGLLTAALLLLESKPEDFIRQGRHFSDVPAGLKADIEQFLQSYVYVRHSA